MQSVGTAKGAFNANQVYDVDSDTAKEWIDIMSNNKMPIWALKTAKIND